MICKTIGITHRKVCVGDLRHKIILHSRDITEPGFGEVDFGEKYEPIGEPWAAIRTTEGKVRFDGVGQDVLITHAVYTRFRKDVTSETWVELDDGRLLDVVAFEDLDEHHEWLFLACTEKGSKDVVANQV